jgi:hypothetical protein
VRAFGQDLARLFLWCPGGGFGLKDVQGEIFSVCLLDFLFVHYDDLFAGGGLVDAEYLLQGERGFVEFLVVEHEPPPVFEASGFQPFSEFWLVHSAGAFYWVRRIRYSFPGLLSVIGIM